MTTLSLGPEHGTLTVFTGVEGRLARLGHALTLRVREWRAQADRDGDTLQAVVLTARLDSLEVVKGEGGAAPLTPVDKRIRRNALELLKADAHPVLEVRSTSVEATDAGWTLTAALTLAGRTTEVTLPLHQSGQQVRADVPLSQRALGVEPYSGVLGGLRVRDDVLVRLALTLP